MYDISEEKRTKDLEHPDHETSNSSEVSRLGQDFPVTTERGFPESLKDSKIQNNRTGTGQSEGANQKKENNFRLIPAGRSRLLTDKELEPKIGLFGFKNEKYIWPG